MAASSLTSLRPRCCEVCSSTDRVIRCEGCQVAFYCGLEHQLSDYGEHEAFCSVIKDLRACVEKEEQKLRDHPGDGIAPLNVFELGVGRFWTIHATRDYMNARYRLVDHILQFFGKMSGRTEAIEVSLNHLLDMLRLCRGDNMGLRSLVPALYIRLGRDQAAYDFMKWCAITPSEGNYDWSDMNVSYLDVKDADAFESPRGMWVNTSFVELSHAVAVALVKARICTDLRTLLATAGSGRPAEDMLEELRGFLVSPIVESRPELLTKDESEIGQLLETVMNQIKEIYQSISHRNPHYWRFMLDDPASAISNKPIGIRPNVYMPGSDTEAYLVIDFNLYSWIESPGAVGLIRALHLELGI